MAETWLRSNRRALGWGLILPTSVGLAGALLASGAMVDALWLRIAGWLLIVPAAALAGLLVWQIRQPRIGFADGRLLVQLRAGRAVAVPIELVECFLLSRTAAMLPGRRHRESQTASVVIRLRERATNWAFREVHPSLGTWCGGQITIRGTWCEPLDVELVRRLNARLALVQRAGGDVRPSQVTP